MSWPLCLLLVKVRADGFPCDQLIKGGRAYGFAQNNNLQAESVSTTTMADNTSKHAVTGRRYKTSTSLAAILEQDAGQSHQSARPRSGTRQVPTPLWNQIDATATSNLKRSTQPFKLRKQSEPRERHTRSEESIASWRDQTDTSVEEEDAKDAKYKSATKGVRPIKPVSSRKHCVRLNRTNQKADMRLCDLIQPSQPPCPNTIPFPPVR